MWGRLRARGRGELRKTAAAVHSEGAQPDKEHGRNEEQIDRLQSLMGKLRNIVVIQLTMR